MRREKNKKKERGKYQKREREGGKNKKKFSLFVATESVRLYSTIPIQIIATSLDKLLAGLL